MLHEFGHALISEFGLPIIGQEEDAVDAFATLDMIDATSGDVSSAIEDVAEAHPILHDRAEEAGEVDFYDEHDVDAQRGFRAICMLYGSDPKTYRASADWIELPQDRREICQEDTAAARDSWAALLANYVHTEDHDHVVFDAQAITVSFEPAKTATKGEAMLKSLGILKSLASELSHRFEWQLGLKLIAKECGEPNAYWGPQERSVTICYELVEGLIELDAERGKTN